MTTQLVENKVSDVDTDSEYDICSYAELTNLKFSTINGLLSVSDLFKLDLKPVDDSHKVTLRDVLLTYRSLMDSSPEQLVEQGKRELFMSFIVVKNIYVKVSAFEEIYSKVKDWIVRFEDGNVILDGHYSKSDLLLITQLMDLCETTSGLKLRLGDKIDANEIV